MRRMRAPYTVGWALAIFALAGVSPAQEPTDVSSARPMSAVAAPRTDLYSTYSDAFANPSSVYCPPVDASATQGAMSGMMAAPRHYKLIFSNDVIRWGRTDAGNVVLTRTTPNIFDPPLLNADPGGLSLYGSPLDNQPIPGGIIAVDNVNTPGINGVFYPGDNPNLSPLTPPAQGFGEILFANEVRTQTDDFDYGREYGFRPKLEIEFQNGTKASLSYFWVSDFEAGLIEDVSGSAIYARVVTDTGNPFVPQWQRFGYLNSEFVTANPLFGGERRRQVGDAPSAIPHNPAVEAPPVYFSGADPATSADVPREPTVNDPARLGVLDGPENTPTPSLLWQDGEVMIATYSSDVQGADFCLEHPIFEWFTGDWRLSGIGGVKYLALDEGFTFTFADIAPTTPIGDTGYLARSGFDRFEANQVGLPPGEVNYKAQPSTQTVAIHKVSVDNDIIAPSVGLHAVRPVFGMFEVDLASKGSWGVNFLTRDSSLVRGDGVIGFDRHRTEHHTSGIIEWKLGMNFVPHPNIKLRAGFEAMWLIEVATAISNINYNLDRDVRPNNRDDVLFFGWYFGGEFTY